MTSTIQSGQILKGPLFSAPMRVETVRAVGQDTWTVGLVGAQSERFRSVTLTARDLDALTIIDPQATFSGDGNLLRLGLQAYALGIAYEFDSYFGLSISRVDPLPHQLAAVYDHLLKLARVRFLLADDAGAGKTIMAGLLIRELKLRGLAERVLIICPANLTFQWQRELKEKFDEKFVVLKGETLRDTADHFLLLTATPHKGDPENFSLFLQLLDRDAYADVKSIRQAMDRRYAPLYLRRTKEAMVYFPERQADGSWLARKIFIRRIPHTIEFQIDNAEFDLYRAVTRFMKQQSAKRPYSRLPTSLFPRFVGTRIGARTCGWNSMRIMRGCTASRGMNCATCSIHRKCMARICLGEGRRSACSRRRRRR